MKTQVVLIAMISLATPACAHLDAGCAKALPVLAQGNVLVSDAQDALAQANSVVANIPDLENRQKAMEAIDKARAALRMAEAILHTSSEACRTPNLPVIFQAFVEAWKIVRGFISVFGGTGVEPVMDPKIYTLSIEK